MVGHETNTTWYAAEHSTTDPEGLNRQCSNEHFVFISKVKNKEVMFSNQIQVLEHNDLYHKYL